MDLMGTGSAHDMATEATAEASRLTLMTAAAALTFFQLPLQFLRQGDGCGDDGGHVASLTCVQSEGRRAVRLTRYGQQEYVFWLPVVTPTQSVSSPSDSGRKTWLEQSS